jgi:2-polyprenyl-3-methyl-5-hydroxy-6-metoxy-1,4-benzoquinol methylase
MHPMPFLPDLSRRNRQPEIMDQPGLDPAHHAAALIGLRRVNRLSNTAGSLWGELAPLARSRSQPLRLLDIATGGGDIPIALWQKAKRAGLPIQIEGCDKSPTAIEQARQRAETAGADVRFFSLDVLTDMVPTGYDVATCSLFLHHLDEAEGVELLRRMAAAARVVLVSDLVRCRTGWLMAYLGTRLLTRSPVVHVDGPLSVQAALTPDEALSMAARAGLEGATVRRCWPWRYILRWESANRLR